MNVYAIINGINSILAFVIAVFILLRNHTKPQPLTFCLFYLLISAYALLYTVWGFSQSDLNTSLFWLRALEYPVIFIHTAYFHFALVFANRLHQYKGLLFFSYVTSIAYVFINYFGYFFDTSYVRDRTPFVYWPHGTLVTASFIFIEVIYVLLSFFMLYRAANDAQGPIRTRIYYFLLAGVIGWSGGLTSWLNYFDSTPIQPIGNPGITLFLIVCAYLIFRHDLLGLNIVVRRTFIYGILTLFIAMTYFVSIFVSEHLFRAYFGYRSFLASLLTATTIALLFNPVRGLIARFVDRRFFGHQIEALSEENERMKLELQKQDRMKAVATLAAGMAHEIKNPLTTIKTFVEFLPLKYDDPEFRESCKRIVGDEVDRMNNIVSQLLDFSKPKPPQIQPSPIEEVINGTLDLLSNNLIKARIEVHKRYAPLPVLLLDRNQFKQVFLNLFLNSINAMPHGGRLDVTTMIENGKAVIQVTDSGTGIAKEALPHVFDPFFTTEKEGGTGLGLAIVYGIVKEHGGTIKVQSNEGGTAFRIELGIPK